MALIPAKSDFTIKAYGGAMDSRYPDGEPPPDATVPVRLTLIPEIVFVAGFPEDEYLGYYMLEPNNLIDPDYVWWDTVGAEPRNVSGATYAPVNTTSIVGTLPAGVTYDPLTTKLAYDGTGSANDRKTVSLKVGTLTQSFVCRVVVPQVIWGAADGLAALPAVYQAGGDLDDLPKVTAHQTGVTASSFYRACQDFTANGTTADLASIILVTRGTYDHDIEFALSGYDIEWRVGSNRDYLMILGEPTRGQAPLFYSATGRKVKFAIGSLGASGVNSHLKNIRTSRMYSTVQPDSGASLVNEWTYRKTHWELSDVKVIGDFLNEVSGSTISSATTRSDDAPSLTQPWRTFVELSTFDRCGVADGTIDCGGGFYGYIVVNGCRFFGSAGGVGYAIGGTSRYVKTYNSYVSYLADPDVVDATYRLRGFAQMPATSELDAFNVRGLLGRHGASGVEVTPRRLFNFVRTTGAFTSRHPPYYPARKAEAAPFTDLEFDFTGSGISTAGAVPQLSFNGGAFADAGSAVQVSGERWTVTLASTDMTSNGTYKLRLRNAGSTDFSSTLEQITLLSYQNAGYWLVADNRLFGQTDAEYSDIEQGPKAFAPDDGAAFWSLVDRNSGTDPRTHKRFIAFCDITWDTRPLGSTAANGADAIIYDEGQYPIDDTNNQYGQVPTGWTDLGVTWVANSTFANIATPWASTQYTKPAAWTLHGVGSVPSPLPTPLVIDYLASNVTSTRPVAATVDLPDWWGD